MNRKSILSLYLQMYEVYFVSFDIFDSLLEETQTKRSFSYDFISNDFLYFLSLFLLVSKL